MWILTRWSIRSEIDLYCFLLKTHPELAKMDEDNFEVPNVIRLCHVTEATLF